MPFVSFVAWNFATFVPFFGGGFLGAHLRHMVIPRIGVESELQLLA